MRLLNNGLVSVHEEHQSRLEHNIPLDIWSTMDVWEKALLIASRRVRISIANLQSEAEIRQTENKMKKT